MTTTEANDKALDVLVEIASNKDIAANFRIEAAKIILNRPRFFLDENLKERI